jgi:protease-4
MGMADAIKPKSRWRRRLLIFAVIVGALVWFGRGRVVGPAIKDNSYLLVELSGDFPEMPPAGVLERVVGGTGMSLFDLLGVLRDAREDPRIKGVVLRLRTLGVGWGKAQDIREAIVNLRQQKPVIAYVEQEVTGGLLEYYVASAAEKIYMPPGASTPLTGLIAEFFFLGGVWEKLGIDPQVEKIREYKTAGDQLAYKEMTPYNREMSNALLDSIYAQATAGIASGRGLTPEAVRALIDRALMTAPELVEAHLADGERFFDEIRTELVGDDGKFVEAKAYHHAGLPGIELGEGKLAIIYATGPIVTGDGGGLQDGVVGSEALTKAFHDAAKDDAIRAIIFRLDSPGGSALASDLIWRATQNARAKKPVIVSMSDVAGSGGYYIAAGASRIIAQPTTLTGSIGVVTWKPNISGFLKQLGLGLDSLGRGKMSRIPSLLHTYSEPERQRISAAVNQIYKLFLSRVAAGRSMSEEAVNEVGRGRVWTGEQASGNGLVDELGGFNAAVAAAKSAAGMPVDKRVEVVFYPQAKDFSERLSELFGTRLLATMPAWVRELRAWMPLLDFPDGSILTLMPERIVIH